MSSMLASFMFISSTLAAIKTLEYLVTVGFVKAPELTHTSLVRDIAMVVRFITSASIWTLHIITGTTGITASVTILMIPMA